MASGSVLDRYMQFAVIEAAFSASGSGGVFAQLVTGLTNMQKVGWEIKRIEYFFSANALDGMTGQNNYTEVGITQSSGIADLNPKQAPVIDRQEIRQLVLPSASNNWVPWFFPIVSDFGAEGKLIVPQNVFLGLGWSHTVAPATSDRAYARIWYREMELSSQDWYDLLQLRLPLGAT